MVGSHTNYTNRTMHTMHSDNHGFFLITNLLYNFLQKKLWAEKQIA